MMYNSSMTRLNQTLLLNRLVEIASTPQPLYMVLIGAPGSGKSTFIKALGERLDLVVGSTDNQIEKYAAANGMTYSQAFGKLNFKTLKRQMEEDLREGARRGKHCVVDQTNMGRKQRKDKLEWASPRHAKVAIDFDVPDKVLIERCDARANATGKLIPRHVLFSMLKNHEAPSKDEGFDYVFTLT